MCICLIDSSFCSCKCESLDGVNTFFQEITVFVLSRVYSYRALVRLLLDRTEQRRLLLPLPFPIWNVLATVASILPNPPLTGAQVMLLKSDNVVAETALSLDDLGVNPTALEDILPDYGF